MEVSDEQLRLTAAVEAAEYELEAAIKRSQQRATNVLPSIGVRDAALAYVDAFDKAIAAGVKAT